MEDKGLSAYERQMARLKSRSEIEKFIDEHCNDRLAFHEYINKKILEKDLSVSEVIHSSGININYAYNIINGARKNPGRDKVIAMCIGSGLSFSETQTALDSAGVARLSYCNERDIRISGALNNQVADVIKVNMDLSDNGLEPISV